MCQSRLFTNACHAGRELFEVACTGRRVLREFVDNGGSGQHRLLQSETLVFLEEHGELAHVLNRSVAEVISEGDVDFVGSFYEVKNLLLGGDTEFARVPGKCIELLAGGAGIHLFEAFVEVVDSFCRKPGVLAYLCFRLLHVCISSNRLLHYRT